MGAEGEWAKRRRHADRGTLAHAVRQHRQATQLITIRYGRQAGQGDTRDTESDRSATAVRVCNSFPFTAFRCISRC